MYFGRFSRTVEETSDSLMFNAWPEEEPVRADGLVGDDITKFLGENTHEEIEHQNCHDKDNGSLNGSLGGVRLVIKFKSSCHKSGYLPDAADNGCFSIIVCLQVKEESEAYEKVEQDESEDNDAGEALNNQVNAVSAHVNLCEVLRAT